MKNYLEQIKEKLVNLKVNGKFGEGIITDVERVDIDTETNDIIVSIQFVNTTKRFIIATAVTCGSIVLCEEETKKYNEAMDICNSVASKLRAEKKALEEAEAKKREEEAAEAERVKKLIAFEKSYEKRKRRLLEYAQNLGNVKLDTTDAFYVALGYIAKHAKNITAAMPDYLESWFVDEFGDVTRRVVDSRRLTVNGFQMQWTLSMLINLDTNDNLPAYLVDLLQKQDKKVKAIANTEFTYKLLSDFGFSIGKVQDINNILSNIPNDKLASFNAGYSI